MEHYQRYLKNKNLSKNTIKMYMIYSKYWNEYLNNGGSKQQINDFLNISMANRQARTIRLIHNALISYFKFKKEFDLITSLKEMRLPQAQQHIKTIISMQEYEQVAKNLVLMNHRQARNWLIFNILFFTGIRVSELQQIQKDEIKNNRLKIVGKGNKERIIFFTSKLIEMFEKYNHNLIAINSKKQLLSIKQINNIIKNIGITYFNKKITPHTLRRSFATNLLKMNTNLEVVKKLLGHSNINTTAAYLQINDDEICEIVKEKFN